MSFENLPGNCHRIPTWALNFVLPMNYGHTMAKSLIQIQVPNKYLGFTFKGLVFCRNNYWLMENMDKRLTLPKWVLINRPKILQMPPKMFGPICPPKPKSLRFSKKSSPRVSVVHGITHSESKIIRFKILWTQTKQVKNVMNMKKNRLENFSESFPDTTLLSLVKPSNPFVSTRLDNKTKKLNVPNPPLRPLLAQSVIASCLDLVKEIQSKNILRMERKTLS